MNPYEALRNAIVLQGVRDWQAAENKLKKRPKNAPAKQMRDDCETFFCSSWFEELTGMDGSAILRKLKLEEGINDE